MTEMKEMRTMLKSRLLGSVAAGAIYIVRNPLDVAISYAHHLSKPIDFAIDFMNLKNAPPRQAGRG
jgi:hypothetical protein